MSNHSYDDLLNIHPLPANIHASSQSPQNADSNTASAEIRSVPPTKPDPSSPERSSTRFRKCSRSLPSRDKATGLSKPISIIVHKHDVLSGRGVNIAQHPGNERFRTLITSYCTDSSYCTNFSVNEKKAVGKEIITHIRLLNPPGRFLKREGKAGVSRGLTGPWEELTEKETLKKACQGLRDCNRLDRTGYANGVKAPEDVKKMAETVTKTGLSAKERAAAAAATLDVQEEESQASKIHYAQQANESSHASMAHVSHHSSHSDLRSIPAFNSDSSHGVKRTRDDIDTDFYPDHYTPHSLPTSVTEACNSMKPPPAVDYPCHAPVEYRSNQHPVKPSSRGSSVSSVNNDSTSHHPYHSAASSRHEPASTASQGAYPGGGYYHQHNAYPDVDYSNHYYAPHHGIHTNHYPPYTHGYYPHNHGDYGGLGSVPENFVPQDYHQAAYLAAYEDDPSHHQPHNHKYHTHPHHQSGAGYDEYSIESNNMNNAAYNRDTNSSQFRPVDAPWPLKKQRTDDSDPSTGMSTSASSPSTPAALMNNEHLGIPHPSPCIPVDKSLRTLEDINVSELADVFGDFSGPVPGGSEDVSGDVHTNYAIDEVLNADGLFSFE
eukprot:scaffold492_cov247-Chaetoceros_neogracile.AAC.12